MLPYIEVWLRFFTVRLLAGNLSPLHTGGSPLRAGSRHRQDLGLARYWNYYF